MASVAACCSILDYVSTAVVSAASASSYLNYEFGYISVFWVTIGILCLFGFLAMLGVKESANIGVTILLIHLTTISILVITSIIKLSQIGSETLLLNLKSPTISSSWCFDLFLGYSVGMLGVTGFETSANYVELQKPGVFPKTLRNMVFCK